jgi:hypothetical protein
MLLNANRKLSEMQIKKAIPFRITTKNKISRINLTKDVKDPYNDNDKILMKETKEDAKKRKTSHIT